MYTTDSNWILVGVVYNGSNCITVGVVHKTQSNLSRGSYTMDSNCDTLGVVYNNLKLNL